MLSSLDSWCSDEVVFRQDEACRGGRDGEVVATRDMTRKAFFVYTVFNIYNMAAGQI